VTASGKIVGQQVTDSTLQDVATEIRRLEPPAHVEQTLVPVADERRVLILEANVAPSPPYTYDGGVQADWADHLPNAAG